MEQTSRTSATPPDNPTLDSNLNVVGKGFRAGVEEQPLKLKEIEVDNFLNFDVTQDDGRLAAIWADENGAAIGEAAEQYGRLV